MAENLRGRALKLLARREHTRRELESKLAADDVEPAEVEPVLKEFEARLAVRIPRDRAAHSCAEVALRVSPHRARAARPGRFRRSARGRVARAQGRRTWAGAGGL